MTRRHLKAGVSAVLDSTVMPHARTFLRALALARNHLPALGPVAFTLLDDGADAGRAAEVAQQLAAQDVDIVIGHFSSDAAMSAARHYAQAGMALITPAATIDDLTRAQSGVFRLCPPDRALAAGLVRLAADNGWRRLAIDADDSRHGRALAAAIAQAAQAAGLDTAAGGASTTSTTHADARVFAGRLAASRACWQRWRDGGSGKPLVLTDDAASPQLCATNSGGPPLYVIGFESAQQIPEARAMSHLYRHQFGDDPETYFTESFAAFEILAALATLAAGAPPASTPATRQALAHALREQTFRTALGPVRFEHGERLGASHAVWRIGPSGWLRLPSGPARTHLAA